MDWWRTRVHPEDAEAWGGMVGAIERGESGASAEYRVRAADDRYVWIWDNCVAVRSPDGTLQRVVGNIVDISDRKQVEEERQELLEREREARKDAERANFAKQEFLATLSHELRTPLSTVLIWAHVLKLKADEPEQVRRAAEVINQNARAQSQMISDLLDMSRIDSGKVRLEVQPIDVGEIVNAAVTAVLPAAEAKEIRISRVIEPMAAAVRGDPNRLQQVLWNLLSNAIKFTPKGGQVQVAVGRVDSHADAHGERYRQGSGAGVPAPCLRALPPGRQLAFPRVRRPGSRAIDRPADRGAARRAHQRHERRARSRRELHRRAAP